MLWTAYIYIYIYMYIYIYIYIERERERHIDISGCWGNASGWDKQGSYGTRRLALKCLLPTASKGAPAGFGWKCKHLEGVAYQSCWLQVRWL